MTTRRFLNRTISVFAAFLVLMFSMTLYSDRLDAANTARAYNVYDAQTGEFLRSYTLEPLAERNNTRWAIGTDDRVEDFSKNGTVQIDTTTGEVSGAVIDSHTIATAAHCVMGKKIYHIYLFDSATSEITLDITDPVEYHLPVSYIDIGMGANQYDYALITVKQDLSEYASCYNLGVATDAFLSNTSTNIYMSGFPSAVKGVSNENHTMYLGTGNLFSALGGTPDQLYYTIDASAGNSGSPVYITESRGRYTYNTIIAIHTGAAGDYNFGTRITTDLIHFYLNNGNKIYETEE